MGVMASYCQICGAPVQHDHYVEMDNMLGIWRGGEDHEVCSPAFPFGDEHAWLKDAVALRLDERRQPVILEGRVHDGSIQSPDGSDFDDGLVFEGLEERAALHRACWEIAGRPQSWREVRRATADDPFAPFKQQLFEFGAFADGGQAWLLVDPSSDSPEGRRNRARISKLVLK